MVFNHPRQNYRTAYAIHSHLLDIHFRVQMPTPLRKEEGERRLASLRGTSTESTKHGQTTPITTYHTTLARLLTHACVRLAFVS